MVRISISEDACCVFILKNKLQLWAEKSCISAETWASTDSLQVLLFLPKASHCRIHCLTVLHVRTFIPNLPPCNTGRRRGNWWYLLTYLLTPWCRVLLEKLTGLQLVKKFPAYHGTRRFITVLTNVRQLSLSWASPIQPICPHPTSWRSILILYTHLRLGLPSDLLSSGFPTKTLAGVLWRLISTNFDGDF